MRREDLIVDRFYLSDENNHEAARKVTGLSQDELEYMVGRFATHSHRAGQMRGEVVVFMDGRVEIRHHFTKKVFWENA